MIACYITSINNHWSYVNKFSRTLIVSNMKKTHKKIENNLHKTLTVACEKIKDETNLFSWLTHDVNYDSFPQSLMISCCLVDKDILASIEGSKLDHFIKQTIKQQLSVTGINNFNVNKQVQYINEH